MDDVTLTIKEAEAQLFDVYSAVEIAVADGKEQADIVIGQLPEDITKEEIKALVAIAKARAKDNMEKFKKAHEMITQLMEELGDED